MEGKARLIAARMLKGQVIAAVFVLVIAVACSQNDEATATPLPNPVAPAAAATAAATDPDPPFLPARHRQSPPVGRVFIQLTDPLDEPEYYCLDVPGAGSGVRLNSALQAHTCKSKATAADELFTIDHPNKGQIYMEAYDLCVEAEGTRQGSALRLKPCSDSHHQLFTLENGLIRLSGRRQDDLCLAVAPGLGIPTGGPSHLRRALTLEGCETIDPTLIRWSVGLFDY